MEARFFFPCHYSSLLYGVPFFSFERYIGPIWLLREYWSVTMEVNGLLPSGHIWFLCGHSVSQHPLEEAFGSLDTYHCLTFIPHLGESPPLFGTFSNSFFVNVAFDHYFIVFFMN